MTGQVPFFDVKFLEIVATYSRSCY